MELGDLITLYRRQENMTIDDLAIKSGVPKGTLNKIIGGVTKAPTLDTVKAIARALGRTLADFDDAPQNAPAYTAEALGIAKKYDVLDDWGQQAVTGVVDVEHARCTAQAKEAAGAPARAPDVPDIQVADKKRERKLQLVARRVEGVPEEEYERLLDNFEDTIDAYMAAKKIKPEDK